MVEERFNPLDPLGIFGAVKKDIDRIAGNANQLGGEVPSRFWELRPGVPFLEKFGERIGPQDYREFLVKTITSKAGPGAIHYISTEWPLGMLEHLYMGYTKTNPRLDFEAKTRAA